MYERRSVIHPRIAGSTEMYLTSITSSPPPGTGTGSAVSPQFDATGSPTGREMSRSWRLMAFITRLVLHRYPAVDREHGSGHVGGGRRGEEQNARNDLTRIGKPPERDERVQPSADVVGDGVDHARLGVRRNDVDRHCEARQLLRCRLAEAD